MIAHISIEHIPFLPILGILIGSWLTEKYGDRIVSFLWKCYATAWHEHHLGKK